MVYENVFSRFSKTVEKYPDNPALEVNSKVYLYSELHKSALGIASILSNFVKEQFVGILASRSLSTYAGILGTLAAGKCYVPFNPKFPVDRIRKIISITECKIFIVDPEFFPLLNQIFDSADKLIILIPEIESGDNSVLNNASFFTRDHVESHVQFDFRFSIPTNFAYLLFTSGTTGNPKGIPISHENLNHYIDFIQNSYPLKSDDICTQFFDTTFDLSVHDLFVTWNAGAKLLVIPKQSVFAPAKVVQQNEVTVWFSVPSTVSVMQKLRILKNSAFPSLRLSLFCGEALPANLLKSWSLAAPLSQIVNLYGPTETTISISAYLCQKEASEEEAYNNIVPIGKIFKSHDFCIVNDQNLEVNHGDTGELCISGPQVAAGYFKDEIKTRESFINLPFRDNKVYYKTGDIVQENKNGNLLFHGRKDNQVQIRGFRVELSEIESQITNLTEHRSVVVAWPIRDGLTEGIIGFVEGEVDSARILAHCSNILPDYMVPSKIICVPSFPLNINGKTDRNQLIKILDND